MRGTFDLPDGAVKQHVQTGAGKFQLDTDLSFEIAPSKCCRDLHARKYRVD